ncbi:uncharacterized protein LOC126986429 [Eriocheir sinensis]|uniref:uncharacterized protein LOC126986429 n=1 Tax=Eriocheir sinensis TaxID=95602 RepID=UPI0021C79729|nr:uncharacterized protein LOC126986429 [Eriocheir sinensis]
MAPQCKICDYRFCAEERQPLSLPCGHTFCSSCVRRFLNSGRSLKCPTCRRTHTLAEGAAFPVNYAILEDISATSTPDETPDPSLPSDSVTLIIRDLTDHTFRLKVPLNATVREVKEALQKDHGFVPQNTRLLFRGRRLDDHKTITFYNIRTGNIVQITTTYLGGHLLAMAETTATAAAGSASPGSLSLPPLSPPRSSGTSVFTLLVLP